MSVMLILDSMPVRDWGIGLEELTEYYHRYGLYYTDNGLNRKSQNWFMTRGVVDQSPKFNKKGKKTRPVNEIDLVGIRVSDRGRLNEIRLIQCTESVYPKTIRKLVRSFQMPRMFGPTRGAGRRKIFTRCVSCVKISKDAEDMLNRDGVTILRFEEMAYKLLRLIIALKKMRRKGVVIEPPLWLIRSLLDKKFFDKNLVDKLDHSLTNAK